ncbi:hypothetical protein DTO212C5_5826 [Paecilomyces variotii]|nr:hypothetical protein DTO212C5_5826 [Paecilomyces variotii]
MPTEVHDVHQHWIDEEIKSMFVSGFLNNAELFALKFRVGTIIDHFRGQYAGSFKAPDMLIRHELEPLPSIAVESGWVESGWAESLPRLHADMRLWLEGGQPDVQLVIVLRWTKMSGAPLQRVKGIFEIWERDASNSPYLKQNGVS